MASDDMHGSLVTISERTMGDTLDTAAAAGARTLSLYDVSDFDEDGGLVTIAGTVYTYDSADMEADTIHLTTGMLTATSVGDQVSIWDGDSAAVVSERVALVSVEDQDGDPIGADVDYSLAPLLRHTTYAAGQSVSLDEDGAGYRLSAVHGKSNQWQTSSTSISTSAGVSDGAGNTVGLLMFNDGSIVRIQTLGNVRVKTPDSLNYMPILASAFTVSSDAALKTRPTAAPDALEIIRGAPSSTWRYLSDEPDVKRVGPMANDLPDWLIQVDDEDGSLGIDLARQSGLHHRAVEQLLERVEALESELDHLRRER